MPGCLELGFMAQEVFRQRKEDVKGDPRIGRATLRINEDVEHVRKCAVTVALLLG